MRVFSFSMLAFVCLPVSDSPRTPTGATHCVPATPAASNLRVSALGMTEVLVAELAGIRPRTCCNLAQAFPLLSVSHGNCADDGGPMTTSLTEAIACVVTYPDWGPPECSVTGTVTWTPGCCPACNGPNTWDNQGIAGQSSRAGIINGNYSYWTNPAGGVLNVSGLSSCVGTTNQVTVHIRVTDCTTSGAAALSYANTNWYGYKVYDCFP